MESLVSLIGMDYFKYIDMFKNVLEFYGMRCLRLKLYLVVE